MGAALTLEQMAVRIGGPVERLRHWRSLGLIGAEDSEEFRPGDADDVAMLRQCKVALEAGFPEEALTQVLRVYADALGRVADSESRLFHFYVHQRLQTAGLCRRE